MAKKGKKKTSGSVFGSLLKALLYIFAVLGISFIISVTVISVANDVFAFVKNDDTAIITVDENTTLSSLSAELKQQGIIKYPRIFEFYSKLRKKSEEYNVGTYTVSANTGYDKLIATFNSTDTTREQVSVTISEGKTVDEIIELLLSYGIGTKQGFVEAINNYDFDYWFVDELKENLPEGRKYRLEGYLYPDTYYFFTDSDEVTVINKLLTNFNKKFSAEYRNRCEELGYSVDQMITLASIIQKEAVFPKEFATISSVFHNRLAHPEESNGRFDSDATIQYILKERKETLNAEDIAIDNPYNTRKYPGFPPGAISNPGLDAISAALYPESTNYYYFLALSDGTTLFARTYSEHSANVAKYGAGK